MENYMSFSKDEIEQLHTLTQALIRNVYGPDFAPDENILNLVETMDKFSFNENSLTNDDMEHICSLLYFTREYGNMCLDREFDQSKRDIYFEQIKTANRLLKKMRNLNLSEINAMLDKYRQGMLRLHIDRKKNR